MLAAQPRGLGTSRAQRQSFLNYGLLALVYGGLRVRAARRAGGTPFALSVPIQHYALLAAVDVEANFLIVKAYQFTNITSVTLLDSARRASQQHAMSHVYQLRG